MSCFPDSIVSQPCTFNQTPLSEESVHNGVLVITAVALVGIALLTTALLAHTSVIQGVNSLGQNIFLGSGSVLSITALSATAVCLFCVRRQVEALTNLSQGELEAKITDILDGEKDVISELEKLASGIPLETLEGLIQQKYESYPGLEAATKRIAKQAELYLEARAENSPTAGAYLRKVFETILNVLDTIFMALGIADVFAQPDSKLEGDFKFQKIMMLISLFTLLTATLLPMLGVTTGASIVGGTLLTIAIMSLIWPRIRPLPSRIPEGENWTEQVRDRRMGEPQGRGEVLNRMSSILQTGLKHPLLIGSSGVGKTQTVKAFAHAIERGDYPELKGMTVFYFNTADLVTSKEIFGGGNKILKRISEGLGENRENCILVLDEVHLAYKKGSPLGEQLKTYLDDKENNFPHVIGLTTNEEYLIDIYRENAAGDRRFEAIPIESTDPTTTLAILGETLVRRFPDAVIDRGALDYIIEKTNDKPQPLAALHLLFNCISKTTNMTESTIAKEIEEASSEMRSLAYTGVVNGAQALEDEEAFSNRIEALEAQLAEKKPLLEGEQETLAQLTKLRTSLAAVRDGKYRNSVDPKRGVLFLLQKYFVEALLECRIRETSERLGFDPVICREVVDQVLSEEARTAERKELELSAAEGKLSERQRSRNPSALEDE